jgi:hypothetical protein
MSHDRKNPTVIESEDSGSLSTNPLYEYLLDLQKKRIQLLETLAPNRHLAWQAWVLIVFIILWIVHLKIPVFSEVTIFSLTILGPIAILAGSVYAGWHAQMIAVSNYPSPLDNPRALEILLSTPLTEKEITDATVAAYLKFPFMGFSWTRFFLIMLSMSVLAAMVWSGVKDRTLPFDIFLTTMELYAPAFCVFIYSPLLTALDILYTPRSSLLGRRPDSLPESRKVSGHSGRLLIIITFTVIVTIMGLPDVVASIWAIIFGCPLTILAVGLVSLCLYLLAPKYIEHVRRS